MVTIREVATAAGVSPSTVSYVVTGNKKLPAATVAKVRASILELGYTPNAAGRALSLGRTNIIGVVASILTDLSETEADIFMRFVRAAMFSAKEYGYDILMMGRGKDELVAAPLVDGLLVMDIRFDDPRLPVIKSLGRPTVLVGMPDDPHGMSAVDLDFAGSAHLAVEHLAALGHRDIAVLGSTSEGTSELSWSVRFERGMKDAAESNEVAASFWAAGSSDQDLDRWLKDAARERPDTSAIVLLNVALLDALLRRAAERGVSIPRDLSIVVLATDEHMERRHPDITLLNVPGAKMLERAIQLLRQELSGEGSFTRVLIPPRLIDRGSTAQAAPGGPLRALAARR